MLFFCDKNMNVNSATGQINFSFRKRKKRFAFIVKKHQFDILENTQVDNLFKVVIKGCKDKCYRTFGYRCIYDTKLIDRTSGEVFYVMIFNNFKQL